MYRLHKDTRMFWRDVLMNAVAQVKDMPFTLTESGQNCRHLFFDAGWRRIQHGRIHIALERHFMTYTTTRIGNVSGPVET